MQEGNITASGLFAGANKMLGAYHTVLLPICRETDLPADGGGHPSVFCK